MFISLKVENAEMLPGGAPLDYRSADRGAFEIGRQGSDWTLPDPERIVSSRHCSIAYRDGGYWLRDLSRNGTFVNGSRERVGAPYRLRHGDRLRIGRYIVRVALEEAAPAGRDANKDVLREAERAAPFSFADDPFLARHGKGDAGVFPRQEEVRGTAARAVSSSLSSSGQPSDDLLRHIADAAGIPREALAQRDPREVATEIGVVLRLVAEELSTLLKARAAAKSMVKSSHRTMIGGAENNPLKFVPSTGEMLEIMFSRRRPGYMDAARSVEDAFRDLKTHEMATYAAMQTALARLIEDISPTTIEKKLAPSSFMSKKARAWDALLAAWAAREEVHE
ncbi:MAG: type VI secretion system-associated FHA domain protein TagH, partial [Rhizobiales bacterium]|nr:type VI secretion system-associated FHA domain protein TagH [Hyphomicrobiales bacterium]